MSDTMKFSIKRTTRACLIIFIHVDVVTIFLPGPSSSLRAGVIFFYSLSMPIVTCKISYGFMPKIAAHKKRTRGSFPGGPLVKTSPSNAREESSIPDWGAKTPHDSRPKNQNIKQKEYCNKFSIDF